MMRFSRTGMILSIALILSGCAWISYDKSESRLTSGLIEHCHATVLETALFHHNPEKVKARPKGDTYLIQTGFPTNEWEATRYADDWEEVMILPPGTEFRVTQVFDQGWGSQGRYWLVYAKLIDADIFDREFIIPSGNFTETGQIWVSPASSNEGTAAPSLQENFVTACDK